ncbi:unnamed protein product [Cylicocyclus nassatus]|uniref:EndoU domain-containing protein n=1 Tax=Cylicocyclus nassatus TaxID=53992 RepID=A0AA36GPN1_CYLNA|nr:unnamed protein product [Cylicocyclus nassatus]
MNITLITTAYWVFTCVRKNRSRYPTCFVPAQATEPSLRYSTTSASSFWSSTTSAISFWSSKSASFSHGPSSRYSTTTASSFGSSTTSATSFWSSTLASFSHVDISDKEIKKLSKEMRATDDNKALSGQVIINLQNKYNRKSGTGVFFERVDPKLFERPTFKAFLDMTDNFNPNPKVREPQVSLKEEQREVDAFLTAALNSKPWQIFYRFLNMKGLKHAENRNVFRKWIEQIWFEHYSRSRGEVLDSSGFEHVFIGEFKTAKKKKKIVNGLHNWIRFYQLEQDASENFYYKEYKDHRKNILAALRYSWRGAEKPLGSMFVGTSPEYDMAIFTLCFLARPDKRNCNIVIDECVVKIQTHTLNQEGKSYVGSAFPLIDKSTICGRKH